MVAKSTEQTMANFYKLKVKKAETNQEIESTI